MKITENKTQARSFAILILLSLVWGSSFIMIKKALIAFSPVEVACMRISISAIAFVPFLIWQWKSIEWRYWKYFLIVGLTGSGIPAFMYATAQTEISSTMSGVLNSLTPIFTLIVSVLIFKNPFQLSKFQGVLLGFLGAATLFMMGGDTASKGNQWYGLFVLIGTICYGFSANVVQHNLSNVRSLIISTVSFVLIGPPAIIYLLSTDIITTISVHSHGIYSLGAVIFLSLVGTVMASILFYYLVQITDAVFSSSVAYLMPIVAIGWGLVDGEIITFLDIIGMMLILAGVYQIKRKSKK